ncbi:MAG: carboxypeptidase regulatory-like domain-containing protein [Chlorobiaceae bacterium]|nr:carboxypeptidase regulatory-like domain-containing protein [Chlorobiaceae bacterium]
MLRYFVFVLHIALFALFSSSVAVAEEAGSLPAPNPVKTPSPSVQAAPLNEKVSSGMERLLVGIYINNRLEKEDTVFLENKEYWIPLSLFLEKTGLKEERRAGATAFYPTNIGVISFNTARLKEFDAVPCISFTDLKTTFLASPEFNQQLFAVMLTIPWSAGSPKKMGARTADILAPDRSISFIGIEASADYDFNSDFNRNLQLASGGRLLGGVWNITAATESGSAFTPSRYHWTTFNNKLALRFGTGYSGSYSLIGSTNMTGVQIGWNNHSIMRQLDAGQDNASELFLNIDASQLRTIEGNGPPASIAELRFDGEVFQRQRIGLDGKFYFENVRMSTDLRKTEVYIYLRSVNEKPVKVIDFSQSVAGRALPQGELLIRGGLGKTGNLLNQQERANNSDAAFGNVLYGLHSRVTLEAAMQLNPLAQSSDLLVGTIFSPGANWNAALYGARSNERSAADIRVEGHYTTWSAAYWGTFRQDHFAYDFQEKDINHLFRWGASPFRQLGVQIIAHYEKLGDRWPAHYVLPAVSLYPFSRLTLSATPDDFENYRYEAGLRIGDYNTLRSIYQNDIISVDYQRNFSDHFNVRLLNDYHRIYKTNVTNLVLNWYPKNNTNDLIETAISRSASSFGVAGSWTRYINTGLRVALQYAYQMKTVTNITMGDVNANVIIPETQKNIALAISWDLGWSNRGLFPINRNAVTLTRGAIAGSLDIGNETKLSSADINNISILLNGRQMQQQQIDGSFFIGSLKPGIYNVAVDPEKLPIELAVDQKERKVEVKSGAVTALTIPVYAEFGVAGFVADASGNGVANVLLEVSGKEGKTSVKSFTNEFGYFRADTLRSGSYRITPVSVGGRPILKPLPVDITIKDDFLFDVNMTIVVPPPPPPAEVPASEVAP